MIQTNNYKASKANLNLCPMQIIESEREFKSNKNTYKMFTVNLMNNSDRMMSIISILLTKRANIN